MASRRDSPNSISGHPSALSVLPIKIALTAVRRQNLSDRKGLDLKDYLAHLVSFTHLVLTVPPSALVHCLIFRRMRRLFVPHP